MKILTLLGILAVPAVIGSIAVVRMPDGIGFCIALFFSLLMLRESVLICLMLVRHWRLFGREFWLVEQNGALRWIHAPDQKMAPQHAKVRRRVFHSSLFNDIDDV